MSSIFFDYRQRKYAQALRTCQHYIGNSMRVIPIARDPSWSDLPLVGTAWGRSRTDELFESSKEVRGLPTFGVEAVRNYVRGYFIV